jgi:hypothetical protein
MKRLVLGLVVFLGFAVANGYCFGIKDLKARIDELEKEKSNLQNQIAYLKAHKERIMPITWELAIEADENLLRNLSYYLSAPLKLVTNHHERKFEAKDGVLVITEENDPEEITIHSSYKGTWQNTNPVDRKSFIINFQEKNITLKFDLDEDKNNYFLSGVLDPANNLTLHPDGILPYLCIYLDFENDNINPVIQNMLSEMLGKHTQAVPPNLQPGSAPIDTQIPQLASATTDTPNLQPENILMVTSNPQLESVPTITLNPQPENTPMVTSNPQPVSTPMFTQNMYLGSVSTVSQNIQPANDSKIITSILRIGSASSMQPTVKSRDIIGNGILNKDSIVAYIQSKNTTYLSRAKIEEIVGAYIAEAGKEHINHDISIAQMCEGTNFLGRKEKINVHNYGDLADINRRKTNFKSMTLGIRAHIQQIKLYASSSRTTAEPQVDPARLKRVEVQRGKYSTLDSLFPVWVTGRNSNAYKDAINKILHEMYDFI